MEALPPEAFGDQRDCRTAGLPVSVCKDTAQQRLSAKHRDEVRRNARGDYTFRGIPILQHSYVFRVAATVANCRD